MQSATIDIDVNGILNPELIPEHARPLISIFSLMGMSSPQVYRVAIYLGVVHDLSDPASVFDGLKECREVLPSDRRRIVRMWARMNNLGISEHLESQLQR